jgi:hypothetical protein
MTLPRVGKKVKSKGLQEIWVFPAEANGWRADFFKRKGAGSDRIYPILSEWFRDKSDAIKKANTYKKYL